MFFPSNMISEWYCEPERNLYKHRTRYFFIWFSTGAYIYRSTTYYKSVHSIGIYIYYMGNTYNFFLIFFHFLFCNFHKKMWQFPKQQQRISKQTMVNYDWHKFHVVSFTLQEKYPVRLTGDWVYAPPRSSFGLLNIKHLLKNYLQPILCNSIK